MSDVSDPFGTRIYDEQGNSMEGARSVVFKCKAGEIPFPGGPLTPARAPCG